MLLTPRQARLAVFLVPLLRNDHFGCRRASDRSNHVSQGYEPTPVSGVVFLLEWAGFREATHPGQCADAGIGVNPDRCEFAGYL